MHGVALFHERSAELYTVLPYHKYIQDMLVKLAVPELRLSASQWHVTNTRLTLDVDRAICVLVDNLQFL